MMAGLAPETLEAMMLTLKLALVTTVLLLLIATPLAWWLSRWHHPLKSVIQAIITLPLVLPPTVLGFYLLLAFSPDTLLGSTWLSLTGQTLAFSFEGILLGSLLYSLPFAVQPLYAGFRGLDPAYLDVAATMGLNGWPRFWRLIVPMARRHFYVAAALSFAHTIGEFGVVLMIGGNIAGETRVLSIALFEQVELMQYDSAHQLALILLIFSVVSMALIYRLHDRGQRDAV